MNVIEGNTRLQNPIKKDIDNIFRKNTFSLDTIIQLWYNYFMMFSETYIKNGELTKTAKHFYICQKCGLVQVCPMDDSYEYSLCWICFLKSKGFYKSAMKEIKIGWFTWSTHILDKKLGWSFAERCITCQLFMSILKSKNLNKTSKIPENAIPQDYGWSNWQIQTADKYYNA